MLNYKNQYAYANSLLAKDIWSAEEIGLMPAFTQSAYQLNFNSIQPGWLRQAVKQFIRLQAATRSYNTCRTYITTLTYFSDFLQNDKRLLPQQLNRATIVEYLEYLNTTSLNATTKNIAVVNLRTFIETVAQEEWLPFIKTRIIFGNDIPARSQGIPRFIPEYIIMQLNKHLHSLAEHMQRLIRLLLETGRRISEICSLPYDCLEPDKQGDYFLRIIESKMRKSYLIPITKSCFEIIMQQQQYVREKNKTENGYLFPSRHSNKTKHATARHVNESLNILALEKNIADENGKLWHFSTHQFRHTVGTRMINAGVPQHIVQRYLGHESPEMTARYAYIHDNTLKEAFQKYQGKMVDVYGKTISAEPHTEEQWLKHNIMAQALPNGFCGLPLTQQRCPHANACLTCANFKTNKQFLPQHTKQLQQTIEIIHVAKENGWQRQLEMNEAVKKNLEIIINKLKETEHESA